MLVSLLQQCGFDDWRLFSLSDKVDFRSKLHQWLEKKYHANLQWMEERAEIRGYLLNMWPQAKSCLVVGLNYAPDANPLENLSYTNKGNISVYARGDDYHDVLKKKLKKFARLFVAETKAELKLFVDTAPVMEKPLAALSGLGWQGKHTNLVSRKFGSWLFLGVFITDYIFEQKLYTLLHKNNCGNCRKCIDICPTKAFPKPYVLDANKCISYLTIEHKGEIPVEFRKAMGNRIYGCDDCLSICPWNKFAQESQHMAFAARDALNMPSLKQLLQLQEDSFKIMFKKSPVKRIGFERFMRNVLIAAGNSGDGSLAQDIAVFTEHSNLMISNTAKWAMQELALLK